MHLVDVELGLVFRALEVAFAHVGDDLPDRALAKDRSEIGRQQDEGPSDGQVLAEHLRHLGPPQVGARIARGVQLVGLFRVFRGDEAIVMRAPEHHGAGEIDGLRRIALAGEDVIVLLQQPMFLVDAGVGMAGGPGLAQQIEFLRPGRETLVVENARREKILAQQIVQVAEHHAVAAQRRLRCQEKFAVKLALADFHMDVNIRQAEKPVK